MGDLPLEFEELSDVWELLRSGTVEAARSDGFLCVISALSTLRSPTVTEEPWFSWSNTAVMSPPLEVPFAEGGGDGAGGPLPLSKDGSGGGGGGAGVLLAGGGATPD